MSKIETAQEAILDAIIRTATRQETRGASTTYSKDIGPEVRNLAGAYEGLVNAERSAKRPIEFG